MSDENKEVLDLDPNLSSKALIAMESAMEGKVSNIDLLEEGLTNFLDKSYKKAEKRSWFTDHMQSVLAEDYKDMDTNSKLALYNIERQAEIDADYKLLSPTFGAVTEIIKNKNQEQQKAANGQAPVQIVNQMVGSPLDGQIAANVDPRVAAGFNILYNLAESAKKAKEKKAEETKEINPES